MPQETRALWTVAPETVELRTETVPVPGPGQVEITSEFSGISRGTEGLVFQGRVPVSEFQRMRAPFQVGDFPGPVKYGYSNVGRISGGDPTRLGQRVFSLTPHQEYFVVDGASAHPIPDAVPSPRAVLAANMETALNGIWDGAVVPGDHITVIGAGVLGCLLTALLGRIPGCDVEVLDVENRRAEVVGALGGRFNSPGRASGERDVVFHTSASQAGLHRALELCRIEGRVIELSWYGDSFVQVPLGGEFHSRRLRLICSQVGQVSPNKPGWTHSQRLSLALQLLDDDRLDALLEPPIPFAELEHRMKALLGKGAAPTGAPGLTVSYHRDGA
jgi:threonine dehydrogenase-like Zn-dependent dehydrogenase